MPNIWSNCKRQWILFRRCARSSRNEDPRTLCWVRWLAVVQRLLISCRRNSCSLQSTLSSPFQTSMLRRNFKRNVLMSNQKFKWWIITLLPLTPFYSWTRRSQMRQLRDELKLGRHRLDWWLSYRVPSLMTRNSKLSVRLRMWSMN